MHIQILKNSRLLNLFLFCGRNYTVHTFIADPFGESNIFNMRQPLIKLIVTLVAHVNTNA